MSRKRHFDRSIPTTENPEFLMADCQCGTDRCDRIILAMINPVMSIEDGKQIAHLYFPLEHAQGFVDRMRTLAKARGITVK